MHRLRAERRAGLTPRRGFVLGLILFILAAAVVVHRFALGDLRRLEADYIAAREPTACANQSLVPFAFGDEDIDDLDAALEEAIRDALDESQALRRRVTGAQVTAVPPVRDTQHALEDALDAQVALYQAMLDDPDNADDELTALGRDNNTFERRAGRLRNLLLVGAGDGWSRRFACDDPPPDN